MMSPTLKALYETYAAASIEKQLCFSALLNNAATWKFNSESGLLLFGGAHFYRAQILGVEIERARVWLWAWANTTVHVNSRLLKSAEALRAFGEKHDVAELVKPQIPLETISSGELGAIAAGICQADAFYRGAQPGGATLLLVEAPPVRELWKNAPQRIVAVFNQLISKKEINHRNALTHFLHYKGYTVKIISDSIIEGALPTGEQVRASFDARGCLVNIG